MVVVGNGKDPVTVMVDRDMADKFSIGDDISVVLSGKIRGVSDNSYSPSINNKIALQIVNVSVSTTGATPADSELKRMLDGGN